MATYREPKKNTAYIMYVGLASFGTAGTFQSNPTLAAGDVKVSIDGGALANLATLPVVTPGSSKMVKVSLSSGEMNGDNITIVFSDAAGSEWQDLIVLLQTVTNQLDDLMTAASGTTLQADTDDIQTRLPAALVSGRIDASVGAMAANVLTATAIATDAITASKIAADAIGASELAADAVTEIQNGLATPTNITAGTITTVTNLTNAPTAGDLTATMKTSVTTAATAATPTAAAVTGAVGSVTAGVTVTTNNDKTGYGLSAAAVQAIWDALTSALTTVGSIGKKLVDNIDAAISSRSTFAGGAVASVTGNVGGNVTGSIGSLATQAKADVNAEADTALADVGVTAIVTGRIDAAISTRLASASYTAPDNATIATRASQASVDTMAGYVDTEVAAIKAKTDNLPSDPADASDIAAALATIAGYIDTEVAAIKAKTDNLPASPAATSDIPSSATIVAGIFAHAIATGKTFDQASLDIWSVVAGNATANSATNPTSMIYETPDGTTQLTHVLSDTTREVA